jgi:hypothetical protein
MLTERLIVEQEAEDRSIDLPEDEPAIVKLLIQYFYEAEYEPVLLSMPIVPIIPTTYKSGGKGRQKPAPTFPHTCEYDFDCKFACPHHICGHKCDYNCDNFRCDKCIPPVTGSAEQLVTHSKLYEIADKYDVVSIAHTVAIIAVPNFYFCRLD